MDIRVRIILSADISFAFANTLHRKTGKYGHIEKHLLYVADDVRKRISSRKMEEARKAVERLYNANISDDLVSPAQCALLVIDWINTLIAYIEGLGNKEDLRLLPRLKFCIGQLSRIVGKDPHVEKAFDVSDKWQRALGVL